ncbi:hypothetical protein [Pseudoponticoccus marisrubri]|uniref:hypothetical protein n=1 Tax=Pseudoponticoccus marisrubri TaxID=1685382 RepID=UPI000AE67D44|nr:hypothetical protein [Pseudoponticoccus marisrubri]
MYSWRDLEPERGVYDFSIIAEDLAYLDSHDKGLWVQLQDASFMPTHRPVPDYLLTDEFGGGVAAQLTEDGDFQGWVARRWDLAVAERFDALIAELGKEFDGRSAGINLQETAIGVAGNAPGFAPEHYAAAIRARMDVLGAAFERSPAIIYAKFMPDEWLPWQDEGYLRSIYTLAADAGVGLGAPDLLPTRKGQLNHALGLLHELAPPVPRGIAVQDGNYIGETGSKAIQDKRPNIVPALVSFADDFLDLDYMFCVNQPPYFEEDVLGCFPADP